MHTSPLVGLKGAKMNRQAVPLQQWALDRAKFALSASRSQALRMLVALRMTQQAAHRLSQQRECSTIDIGACVTTQKQMWSLWCKEELWRQSFPSSATSRSQSMTPHPGHSRIPNQSTLEQSHTRLCHYTKKRSSLPAKYCKMLGHDHTSCDAVWHQQKGGH